MRKTAAQLLVLALAACSADSTVEVNISSLGYEVGSVKSDLATPAVREAARLNTSRVLLKVCKDTPPAKVAQFREEFKALTDAELLLIFVKEGCAS